MKRRKQPPPQPTVAGLEFLDEFIERPKSEHQRRQWDIFLRRLDREKLRRCHFGNCVQWWDRGRMTSSAGPVGCACDRPMHPPIKPNRRRTHRRSAA